MARRIKKDDVVVVISGAAKNLDADQRSGKVLKVDHKRQQVTVESVNVRRRAIRRSQANPEGGFVEKECPLHISNVMLKEQYDARAAKRGTAK